MHLYVCVCGPNKTIESACLSPTLNNSKAFRGSFCFSWQRKDPSPESPEFFKSTDLRNHEKHQLHSQNHHQHHCHMPLFYTVEHLLSGGKNTCGPLSPLSTLSEHRIASFGATLEALHLERQEPLGLPRKGTWYPQEPKLVRHIRGFR